MSNNHFKAQLCLLLLIGYVYVSCSGIFVALALRFDVSRGKDSQYFKSAFLGYTVGLVLTIVVMNWFQAAQVTLHVPDDILRKLTLPWSTLFDWSSDNKCCVFLPFQPALLYIVPAVIGFLAAHVIWNGEVQPVCLNQTLRDIIIMFLFLTLIIM